MRLRFRNVVLAGLCACTKVSTPGGTPHGATDVAPTATPVATTAPPGPDASLPPAAAPPQLTARFSPLPGTAGPVTIDYLVSDRAFGRIWIPVGDTGSADVFDVATGEFTRVGGFGTAEREVHEKKRMMGPSSATVGDGFVYVGNRATSEVCAVSEKTLALGACLKLPTAPDGVAYVASAKEVWVTTPRDHSITVLDASRPDTLKPKVVVKTDGDPEGYAIDSSRGLFYTNLEDKNRTLAIDVKKHGVMATWNTGCGPDGPRGLAVDEARNLLMVACTDGVRVLDGAHGGAPLGKLETGAGVDNIDYLETTRMLAVAAGKASLLTVARLDDEGQLSVIATAMTAEGARNAVMDGNGNIHVVDPRGARLLNFVLATPR